MIGQEVKIIKKHALTLGKTGFVEAWHIHIQKYEVYFGNGFCGYYTKRELEILA